MFFKALHAMRFLNLIFVLVLWGLSCFMLTLVKSDTPAHCKYEDVRGTWVFSVGPANNGKYIDCSNFRGPMKYEVKIKLIYPDVALDEYNNEGSWTLIYNQGFEVVVAGRKYFAFLKYDGSISYCGQTLAGWSHTVVGTEWACYMGKKISDVPPPKPSVVEEDSPQVNSSCLVTVINKVQHSWEAVHYPQFDSLTPEELVLISGGSKARYTGPEPAPITREQRLKMNHLPDNFDWRDVDGANYVPPVRDQGRCGSCYAFACTSMNEARVRIMTDNAHKPTFSPQDIVNCDQYSQGCNGGFPYLSGGKYGEEYGLVEEECIPYKGKVERCRTNITCTRHYSTNYGYVGGYYGACSEAGMMQAIYERGPVVVAFYVYRDFPYYRRGIYHHVFHDPHLGFNPYHIANHAVVLVGWGIDESSQEKYWIGLNSWGKWWGMGGYFWIRRGNNECGIESMAFESTPIYTYSRK